MAEPDAPPPIAEAGDGRAPLVRRIEQHFRERILSGECAPGSRLPTVRSVAAQIGTTAETVAAAYRLLAEAGLVSTRPGAGTTVLARAPRPPASGGPGVPIVAALATPSFSETYRRLLHIQATGGVASFASYTPAPELAPAGLDRLLRGLVRRHGAQLFDLGPTEGDPALRRAVAAGFERDVDPQRVVVTGGAQEGLGLVLRALVGPSDVVAVESPTYLGALEALAALGARVIGVPVGPDGVDLAALEQVVRERRPRLFYTMPSCHNPTGVTMPPGRRRRLLALARRHELTLVEDGAGRDLRLDEAPVPSLLDLDDDGRVIHVGSVSKTLAAGLRVGYVVAVPGLLEPLLRLKYVTNVHTPVLQQHLVRALLAPRRLGRHLARDRGEYRARRDAMVAALDRHLGAGATFAVPGGGFAVWATLADGLDAADLYRLAVERGVGFVPGAVFFPHDHRHDTLRLCFSAVAPPEIAAGMARLGEALAELRRRALRPAPSRGVPPL
jgi:2-aminoadipate transaminase